LLSKRGEDLDLLRTLGFESELLHDVEVSEGEGDVEDDGVVPLAAWEGRRV